MKTPYFTLLALAVATASGLAADEKPAAAPAAAAPEKPAAIGYSDTPVIPGTQWKVHDIDRPRPAAVTPGEKLGMPPADAVIIFDGKSSEALFTKEKKTNKELPCPWPIEKGELLVTGGDCWTKQQFASCQLHIEWMSAPETKGKPLPE